jgi:hypothetical protein
MKTRVIGEMTIKFHENLFSCSLIATCGQTGTAKLTGAFLQLLVAKGAKLNKNLLENFSAPSLPRGLSVSEIKLVTY